MFSDADRRRILAGDGVEKNVFDQSNLGVCHLWDVIAKYPANVSWSHTLIDSPSNCVTLIAQMPGQGNRKHFHPEWDEWWFIVKGSWEWWIEGEVKAVTAGDIVFIERNKAHKITSVGDEQSIRMAISRSDVVHTFVDEK